ncbi:DUF3331 domain-containing protein [Paraburkholderia sp. 22B1P]|uniref:DUF3331 domain-containing protein n=1 Tax=Paraburkholderia sp. 22B1P TaxID=3080498 RepID=UPI003086E3FA|nr:DUF3331 domain-containing protein [Paraburkholderia sp. 22B1P]
MNQSVSLDIVERALISLLVPQQMPAPLVDYHRDIRCRKMRIRRRKMSTDAAANAVVQPMPAHITVLERLTTKTVVVRWSDARTGHYGDQIWRIGLARIVAFCALTGSPIYPGDAIYRPLKRSQSIPRNWDRMILASGIVLSP